MALEARELGTAEAALAATSGVDKLRMVVRLQALPSEESRSAELALMRHRPDEAEAILLQVRPGASLFVWLSLLLLLLLFMLLLLWLLLLLSL